MQNYILRAYTYTYLKLGLNVYVYMYAPTQNICNSNIIYTTSKQASKQTIKEMCGCLVVLNKTYYYDNSRH